MTAPTSSEILLVEDDPMTRLIMRSLLQEAGYRVKEADMGQSALDELRNCTADLVVLDYYLPDMNGLDVITALGQMDLSIPIIVITGYDDPNLARKVLEAGATQFVHKDSACLYLRRLPVIVKKALQDVKEKGADPSSSVE